MKKYKFYLQYIFVVVMLLACVTGMAGCSSMKLAETFDAGEVSAVAEQIVGYVGEDDYESIVALFRDDLKEILPADTLETTVNAYFADRGAIKEIESLSVIGQKDTENGDDYAVAIVAVEYENQKITYTISFDVNMEIVGFYMK